MNVAWPELLLGAVTMFVLDPSVGTQRRAALRAGTGRLARWVAGGVSRQLRRTPMLWKKREHVRPPSVGEPTDRELAARVRETIAEVADPSGVQIDVRTRRVTLRGAILARDVVRILREVGKVPGVSGVRNRLHVRRLPPDADPHLPPSTSVD